MKFFLYYFVKCIVSFSFTFTAIFFFFFLLATEIAFFEGGKFEKIEKIIFSFKLFN